MINRIYGDDAVVICASSDDNYVPYLLVVLKSIIANSTKENKYDIIIFEFAMSDKNKKLIESQCKGYENFSVRVINIHSELDFDESLLVTRTLTREIWLKSLAVYALKEYRKAIILDCDVVCLQDLAELYKVELEDNLIGAVKFLNSYIYKNNNFYNKRYINLLNHGIDAKEDYFNYGVVLQNLEAFRQTYSLDYFLQLISNQNYLVQDQDLMNILCKGRVVWIDSKWNTYPFLNEEFKQIIRMVPEEEKEYWIEGYEEPACIHYTTPVKPWLETKGVYSYAGSYFWNYASQLENFDFSFFTNQIKQYNDNKLFFYSIAKKQYDDLNREIKEKELYVYGYGVRGKQIASSGLFQCIGYIDQEKSKHNLTAEIPIGGLEIIKDINNSVILISNDRWDKIALMLRKFGVASIYSYACLEKIDSLTWSIEEKDWHSVCKCIGLFCDEKSRKIFHLIISKRNNFFMDRTIKFLDVQEGNQYFRNDSFDVLEEETYVDVGNDIGYTINGFIDYVERKYNKIYGFEMDDKKYCILKNKVKEEEKITLFNVALTGVDCLDNLINEKVTYIKINTEKVKEVIKGGQNIIKRDIPKLVIDVSNNYSDLWEVPLLLESFQLGYKFFLRHHMSDVTETVLYVTK